MQTAAAAAIPLTLFTSGALLSRRAFALARRITNECTASSVATTENSVSRLLGAPQSVRFWLWLPGVAQYVDRTGRLRSQVAGLQHSFPGRLTEIPRPAGEPALGYALLPQFPSRQDPLLDAAMHAVAPILRTLQSQLDAEELIRAARAQSVNDEEAGRREVAQDLHDRAQQRLLALSIDLARISTAQTREQVITILRRSQEQIDLTLHEVHDVVQGLSPQALGDRGLEEALRDLAQRLDLDICVSSIPRLSGDVEWAVYRAIGEAMLNARKHSGCSAVRIGTWHAHEGAAASGAAGEIHIAVSDEGTGGARINLGGGLHSAQERIADLGGDLWVDSSPKHGTDVHLRVPRH